VADRLIIERLMLEVLEVLGRADLSMPQQAGAVLGFAGTYQAESMMQDAAVLSSHFLCIFGGC
jgi:hypothetical protein